MGVRFLLTLLLVLIGLWWLRSWLVWDGRGARLPRRALPPADERGHGVEADSGGTPAARDALADPAAGAASGANGGDGAIAAAAPARMALRERGERVLDADRTSGYRARIARLGEALSRAAAKERDGAGDAIERRRLSGELASLERGDHPDPERLAALERRVEERFEASTLSPGSDARPPALFERPEARDDLKRIKGIGPVMEGVLNALGVTTFRQLADFSTEDIERVSEAIGTFPGRIERDDWVGRARRMLERDGESA